MALVDGAIGITGNDCCGRREADGRDGVLLDCVLSVPTGKKAALASPPSNTSAYNTL